MDSPASTPPERTDRLPIGAVAGPLIVGGIALALAQTALPMSDPDTLWHLVLGRRLADTGSFVLPREGLMSRDYLYNQWLPELVAAGVERVTGLPGVAVLAHAVRALALGGIYSLARRYAGPLRSAGITLLVLVAGLGAFTARPQLAGLALLVGSVYGWRATAHDGRARWWIVGIAAAWAACHGSWLIGVAVGAATVAGMAVRTGSVRGLRGPTLVVAASALMGAALPPGVRWGEQLLAVREVTWFADEWRPPSLTSVHLLAFLLLVLLSGPALVHNGRAADDLGRARAGLPGLVGRSWRNCAVELLTLGLALAVGLSATRGLAIAAVLLVPLAADARRTPTSGRAGPCPTRRGERRLLGAALAVGLIVALGLAPRVAREPDRVPTHISAVLAALPPGTVVANDPALGGWLLWAYPHLVPVIDTRLEAYGSAHLAAVVAVSTADGDWSSQLDRWRVGAVLLPTTSALVNALRAEGGWREVGQDRGYVVLLPSSRPSN